jgi:ribosomal-protein-serine acetyltransferase
MFRQAVDRGIELGLIERRHAEEMFRVAERNRERLLPWLHWAETMTTVDATRAFIEDALQQFARGEGAHLGIWVDGEFSGGMGCRAIDWRNRSTSVGYWLDASRQGRGIITRCCAVFVDHLFRTIGVNRIEIRCATDNLRSAAIPRRLGFVQEGVARQAEFCNGKYADLLVFSMVAGEWRPPAA